MANVSRVTISFPVDLLEKIDAYADENGATRSGIVSLACKQYLIAVDNAPAISQILKSFADLTNKAGIMSNDELANQLSFIEFSNREILKSFGNEK